MATIWCNGEGALFPESDFLHDKQGGLYQPEIHNRGIPHFASGEPVIPPEIPHLEIVIEVDRLAKLVELGDREHFIRRVEGQD